MEIYGKDMFMTPSLKKQAARIFRSNLILIAIFMAIPIVMGYFIFTGPGNFDFGNEGDRALLIFLSVILLITVLKLIYYLMIVVNVSRDRLIQVSSGRIDDKYTSKASRNSTHYFLEVNDISHSVYKMGWDEVDSGQEVHIVKTPLSITKFVISD